jgi:tRNA 2-thiouridine synthesizing protein D
LIFSVCVHGSPPDSESHHSALRFTKAALAKGHSIYRIFFYQDAVRLADGRQLSEQSSDWARLASQHNLELSVCVGAATRRGLINETETQSIQPGFEVVGLGQLIDAVLHSDRIVTFAA